MPNDQAAARFEQFAMMRLQKRSDVTYRAYDLLSKERQPTTLKRMLYAAGQHVPYGNVNEPLKMLQARFMAWGFPVMTLGEVESLLHEFWVYQRIKWQGKKNWPYRDPDDARRLYEENDKANRLGTDL